MVDEATVIKEWLTPGSLFEEFRRNSLDNPPARLFILEFQSVTIHTLFYTSALVDGKFLFHNRGDTFLTKQLSFGLGFRIQSLIKIEGRKEKTSAFMENRYYSHNDVHIFVLKTYPNMVGKQISGNTLDLLDVVDIQSGKTMRSWFLTSVWKPENDFFLQT